jgi:hypothetical protein
MTIKFEKITLWTATETYMSEGGNDHGVTALDYIMPQLEQLDIECHILDSDVEDYRLVKGAKKGPEKKGIVAKAE